MFGARTGCRLSHESRHCDTRSLRPVTLLRSTTIITNVIDFGNRICVQRRGWAHWFDGNARCRHRCKGLGLQQARRRADGQVCLERDRLSAIGARVRSLDAGSVGAAAIVLSGHMPRDEKSEDAPTLLARLVGILAPARGRCLFKSAVAARCWLECLTAPEGVSRVQGGVIVHQQVSSQPADASPEMAMGAQ